MDRATTPEPVDMAQGLSDTIDVLALKARGKSVVVDGGRAEDLPRGSRSAAS